MNPNDYGVSEGWGGNRTTKELVNKFEATAQNAKGEPTAWKDKRAMFFTDGQSLDITDITKFTEGYAVTKFKNLTPFQIILPLLPFANVWGLSWCWTPPLTC